MRCRVDKYTANVTSTQLEIEFEVEQKVYDALPDTTVVGESEPGITLKTAITEAIRLIADETQGGYVVCSTGQKLVVNTATKSSVEVSGETTYSVAVTFLKSTLITTADGDEDDIAAINSMANTDMFTIAVDWGETITGIYEEIGDLEDIIEAINGDSVAGIVSDYCAEMFDSMFAPNEDGVDTYTLTLPMDATVEDTPSGIVATI